MDPLLVVICSASSEIDVAFRAALEQQIQPLVRQKVILLWHPGLIRARSGHARQ